MRQQIVDLEKIFGPPTFPPPCRGRAREGVEVILFHDIKPTTPILTFPLQGGRDWFAARRRRTSFTRRSLGKGLVSN